MCCLDLRLKHVFGLKTDDASKAKVMFEKGTLFGSVP